MDSGIFKQYTHGFLNSPIRNPLLLLATGLACISFIGKEAGDFAISALTIMAIFSMLADNPDDPKANQRQYILAVISLIIIAVLVRYVWTVKGLPLAMRGMPLLFLASYWSYHYGGQVLNKRWKELLLLAVLLIPDRALMSPFIAPLLALSDMPSLSHLTANIAAGVTWILGLPVELEGTHIHAPNVIANVFEGCDGGRILDFMVRLTLVLIIAFPVKKYKWPIILIVSMFLGYLVNVFRVSAMVFVANTGDMQAFDYWHTGEGSKIFNLIAIILFCLVGYFQITPAKSVKESNA